MAAYKIYFRQSVLKDLAKIPKRDLQRIIKRIEMLGSDPRPLGAKKYPEKTDSESDRVATVSSIPYRMMN